MQSAAKGFLVATASNFCRKFSSPYTSCAPLSAVYEKTTKNDVTSSNVRPVAGLQFTVGDTLTAFQKITEFVARFTKPLRTRTK